MREEIDDLDQALGPGGVAEAVELSFLSEATTHERIGQVSNEALIGQAVVISYKPPGSSEFPISYISEAIFHPPQAEATIKGTRFRLPLLNNYYHALRRYDVSVAGRVFPIDAVYYAQQNQVTSACAHACLRIALNTIAAPTDGLVSNRWINSTLGLSSPVGGLFQEQIREVLDRKGLSPAMWDISSAESRIEYHRLVYSVIESGFVAMIGFSTNTPDEGHVIPVYGHTVNSDEWHPQAVHAYAGPQTAPYFPSSDWADHFLIHDDNFGPYFCLSRDALEASPAALTSADGANDHRAMASQLVVGLFPGEIRVTPAVAEAIASVVLHRSFPVIMAHGRGRWWQYLMTYPSVHLLRTLMVSRHRYLEHLASSVAHDGSKMNERELSHFQRLPDEFWISEFSLPALYTGNKSKLGEVLIDATSMVDPSDQFSSLLALRAPSLLAIHSGDGNLVVHSSSLTAHSPLLRFHPSVHEW